MFRSKTVSCRGILLSSQATAPTPPPGCSTMALICRSDPRPVATARMSTVPLRQSALSTAAMTSGTAHTRTTSRKLSSSVRKAALLSTFGLKNDRFCPQARDKHTENSKKGAVFTGLTDENAVNTAVRRVLWNIFTAGIYDKVSETMPWCGKWPCVQHVFLHSSFPMKTIILPRLALDRRNRSKHRDEGERFGFLAGPSWGRDRRSVRKTHIFCAILYYK